MKQNLENLLSSGRQLGLPAQLLPEPKRADGGGLQVAVGGGGTAVVTRHDEESSGWVPIGGAGIDMAFADEPISYSERLRGTADFAGTVGLPTVKHVVPTIDGTSWKTAGRRPAEVLEVEGGGAQAHRIRREDARDR